MAQYLLQLFKANPMTQNNLEREKVTTERTETEEGTQERTEHTVEREGTSRGSDLDEPKRGDRTIIEETTTEVTTEEDD
jgi:hypothetical protein